MPRPRPDRHVLRIDDLEGLCAAALAPIRKRDGIYYTPRPVAERIVSAALDALPGLNKKNVAGLRIVDPACGCGTFLAAAMRVLHDRFGVQRGGHDAFGDGTRGVVDAVAFTERCERGGAETFEVVYVQDASDPGTRHAHSASWNAWMIARKSSGIGASNSMRSPVTGCGNEMRRAWSIWRGAGEERPRL